MLDQSMAAEAAAPAERSGEEGGFADDDEGGPDGDEDEGHHDGEVDIPDGGGRGRIPLFFLRTRRMVKMGGIILEDVLVPKWPYVKMYCGTVLFVILLPMLLVASVLFYAVGNPIAGCQERGDVESDCASYSWWVIFLGIRQLLTLSLAMATEIVVVDILALRTKLFLRVLGPYITLLAVQARGWPFAVTYWSLWNFVTLYGNRRFSEHWLYWQRYVSMMNADNPAGLVVHSDTYERVLIAAVVFGAAVGLKRGWLALYLGKNSVQHYGPELEKLMRKMLLVAEVARLSEEIRDETYTDIVAPMSPAGGFDFDALRRRRGRSNSTDADDDNDIDSQSEARTSAAPASLGAESDRTSDNISRIRKNTLDGTPGVSTATGLTHSTYGDGDTAAEEAMASRPRLDKQSRAFLHLGTTAKIKLTELVGEWEEPEITTASSNKNITIQEVLQFRQAVMCLDNRFPFSAAFGPARTRVACIELAQAVFEDLLLRTRDQQRPQKLDGAGGAGDLLPFETLSLITLRPNGELDEAMARRLIRLFRPDRNGNVSALDFVKSIDKVYKALRTQRAAIANSSQIDRAFEQIVNVLFYFVLWLVTFTILKLNPMALFLSLSGFILSFAFLFGAAASKYFEGILLVLVRRPYDIGDRVAVSNPQNDTSPNGSSTWFVEGVGLFVTTARFATTNEVATYSNGSLATMRIINAMRSPKATVYIYLKFAVDISFDRVMMFKSVIEKFVKDRPRQWLAFSAFRSTRVEADLGFIEYVVVVQHLESWQNIGPILTSKADLASYCLEVQKKLDMRYMSPPMPVNLAMVKSNDLSQEPSSFETDEAGQGRAEAVPNLGILGDMFVNPEQKKIR